MAVPQWSLAELVTAVQAMRGFDLIAAVGIVAETGDLSRFQKPRETAGGKRAPRRPHDFDSPIVGARPVTTADSANALRAAYAAHGRFGSSETIS